MSNRNLLNAKIDSLSEAEVAEVLEYLEVMESVKQQRSSPDPFDEMIIALLADAMNNAPAGADRNRNHAQETERLICRRRRSASLC